MHVSWLFVLVVSILLVSTDGVSGSTIRGVSQDSAQGTDSTETDKGKLSRENAKIQETNQLDDEERGLRDLFSRLSTRIAKEKLAYKLKAAARNEDVNGRVKEILEKMKDVDPDQVYRTFKLHKVENRLAPGPGTDNSRRYKFWMKFKEEYENKHPEWKTQITEPTPQRLPLPGKQMTLNGHNVVVDY